MRATSVACPTFLPARSVCEWLQRLPTRKRRDRASSDESIGGEPSTSKMPWSTVYAFVTVITFVVRVPTKESSVSDIFLRRRETITSLVRAYHGDASQCLDARELLDNGVPFRHPQHSKGEGDGNDNGQSFRDCRDGERNCSRMDPRSVWRE